MTRACAEAPLRTLSVSSLGSWSVKAQQGFLPEPVSAPCTSLQFHGIASSSTPLLRAPGWSGGPQLGLSEVSTNPYRSRESETESAEAALCLWPWYMSRWSRLDLLNHVFSAFMWIQSSLGIEVDHVRKTLYKWSTTLLRYLGRCWRWWFWNVFPRLDESVKCWKQHVSGRWVIRAYTLTWCKSMSKETGSQCPWKQCRIAQELGFNSPTDRRGIFEMTLLHPCQSTGKCQMSIRKKCSSCVSWVTSDHPKWKFGGIFLRVRLAAEELNWWIWLYVCLDSLVEF